MATVLLEQKQTLFPQGVEYSDGIYRTLETSFSYKGLNGMDSDEELGGSANGNRTRV